MFPTLFEPIKIGKIESPNRILMPSMGTLFSMDQRLNERYYQYFERRAEGGAGVIVAGPVGIDFVGAGFIALSIKDDSYIPKFKELSDRLADSEEGSAPSGLRFDQHAHRLGDQ